MPRERVNKNSISQVCQKRFSDWSTLLVHKRLHSGESPYVCHICGRRTKQASNLRSHYTHLHKMNDISGRQVRMNAKIFERFTQQEIDQHLLANGDLIALLTKGQEDYNREQNEKSKVTEKLIETMRTPLRPLKKEAKDEEVKPTLQVEPLVSAESPGSIEPILQTVPPIVIKIRKTERTVKNESDSNTDISAELELSPIFPETELSMDVFDIHISGDLNSMNVDEKPIGTIDSSDQIESVFLIEDADSGVEPSAPPDVKREYEEDQQDLWMNGGFVNAMDTVFETMKPEPPTSIEPKEQIEKKPRKSSKSIKSSKSPKSPKSTKTKTPKTTKKEKRKKDEVNPLSRMPCSICQKRVQRGNWNVHMVDEHSLIDRPFECYICHKPFKKYHQVKYHLRTHYNDERNVVCHLCGDKFVLNAELNKHIFNRHNDIRPFKCDHIQCSKSFKNRNALKVICIFLMQNTNLFNILFYKFYSRCTADPTPEKRHSNAASAWNRFQRTARCGCTIDDTQTKNRTHVRIATNGFRIVRRFGNTNAFTPAKNHMFVIFVDVGRRRRVISNHIIDTTTNWW